MSRVSGPPRGRAVSRPSANAPAASPTTPTAAPAATALRSLTFVHAVLTPEAALVAVDLTACWPLSQPAAAERPACFAVSPAERTPVSADLSAAFAADLAFTIVPWDFPLVSLFPVMSLGLPHKSA